MCCLCKVVSSGLWLSPGDSEEVAAALSQALRNCIERFGFLFWLFLSNFGIVTKVKSENDSSFNCRALRGMSYQRYGDVFARCHPFSQSGKTFRFLDHRHLIMKFIALVFWVHHLFTALYFQMDWCLFFYFIGVQWFRYYNTAVHNFILLVSKCESASSVCCFYDSFAKFHFKFWTVTLIK